jgi:hypothetical protein
MIGTHILIGTVIRNRYSEPTILNLNPNCVYPRVWVQGVTFKFINLSMTPFQMQDLTFSHIRPWFI